MRSSSPGESLPASDDYGEIDVRDRARVTRFLERVRPAHVLHLAARTFVPESFGNERETYEVNFFGTLNLLECLRDTDFRGTFLFISTADAYGHTPENELPIGECRPLRPMNPYSASKAAAEALCVSWAQRSRFKIVIVRPFNHIGPGQDSRFVVSDFACQVIEIKLGLRPPVIETGNLDTTRDFTDVRDVIAAYCMLLERGQSGEVYNVCSGNEVSIRNVLQSLLALSGVAATLTHSQQRERPVQQMRSVGSNQKLRSATGWTPKILLEQSLRDVLSYWNDRLNG